MKNTSRPSRSWTVLQASQESPTLARLSELANESSARLRCVAALLPLAIRKSVKAGPIDGSTWCLVLDNSAVAAKLRQLIPAMAAELRAKGWDVTDIRLKISRGN